MTSLSQLKRESTQDPMKAAYRIKELEKKVEALQRLAVQCGHALIHARNVVEAMGGNALELDADFSKILKGEKTDCQKEMEIFQDLLKELEGPK